MLNGFAGAITSAGNSAAHVHQMRQELAEAGLPQPDLAAVSHWYWDHTFGMSALHIPTIAGRETNRMLQTVQSWSWDDEAMAQRLKTGEDMPLAQTNQDELTVLMVGRQLETVKRSVERRAGHDAAVRRQSAKLLIGREVAEDPKVIIAAYPVHGLDVGAINSIHKILLEERHKGKAILLISEDIDELFALSDRIAVLYSGQLSEPIPIEQATAPVSTLICTTTHPMRASAPLSGTGCPSSARSWIAMSAIITAMI